MTRNNVWGLWAGLALIGLGVLFFLGQLLQFNVMRYLWPVFILAVGVAFFIGMASGGQAAGPLAVPGSVIITVGLILFFQNLFGLWATWAYAWGLIIAGAGLGLVLFGRHSDLPDLRRAGRVVAIIGLGFFFAFGLLFELSASLLGMRSPGGVLWAVLLILVGVIVLLNRTVWARSDNGGPAVRSTVSFSAPDASQPAAQQPPVAAPAASDAAGDAAAPAAAPVTTTEPVSGIRRVRFRAVGDMTIVQGESEHLEIEASQAVRERVRTELIGDMLEIRFDQNWWDWINPRYWNFSTPLRFHLTVRALDAIDTAGVGSLQVSAFTTPRLELHHSGAGSIEIRGLAVDELRVNQAGLGNIAISGQAQRQEIMLSGAGSYQAGRLDSSTAVVNLSGIGSATVWVHDSLDARLSGTGSIEYYGSPRVSQAVSGLGSVRQLGDR